MAAAPKKRKAPDGDGDASKPACAAFVNSVRHEKRAVKKKQAAPAGVNVSSAEASRKTVRHL